MDSCLFCTIASGTIPSHKVWEDTDHLAFLSIFPNTEGVTVVIPKMHHDSYVFAVEETVRNNLIAAAGKVADKITKAYGDVGRVGLIFEGFGVNHLHAKLFPMHGTGDMSEWAPINSNMSKYFERYEGYLSSHDGERADDGDLEDIAKKIRESK